MVSQFQAVAAETVQRPRGPVVVEFGVSLVAQGYAPGYSGGVPQAIRHFLQEGPLHWSRRRAKGGFQIFDMYGVGGTTTTAALARIDEIMNASPRPDWCVVWLGSDVQSGADMVNSYADVDNVITLWKNNITAILQQLKSINIRPIIITLPPHGSWLREPAQYWAQTVCREWLHEYCKINQVVLLNGFQALSRPEIQTAKTCTALSRTSNTVTADVTAHGWSTDDWVTQVGTVDAGFDLDTITNPTVQITVVNANRFTYTHTGANGSATNKGSFVRNQIIPELSSDGWAHLNAKGASKLSLLLDPIIDRLFPPLDDLTSTEHDYGNIAGSGIAATTSTIVSRGMMIGTGGTKSGTAVSHIGSVADGMVSNVVSGNPTSVICRKITREEAGYEHQEWQEVTVNAAAAADCVYEFGFLQTLPSAWAASTAKSVDNWIKPTTPNGYFYVCTVSSGSSGAAEPTWPTKPGQTVTDGDLTWECRLGWMAGDTVFAAAEYLIHSLGGQADALQTLSFGLHDSGDVDRSIMDFIMQSETYPPLYQVGENGYFCTPQAAIDALTTQFVFATRLRVTAGRSATLRLGRYTWRKIR